ncbi:MAG TPA: carbohydrate ABC transporter permease [Nocardioidaceae bacterium]|nr:carbohydrate ABC transporter permease [Nocardioidaceae bacterium]
MVTTARRPKRRGEEVNWALTGILLVASLIVLVPLYFTVAMSLKTSQEAVSGNGFSFPWPLNWSNFSDAWTLTNFPRAFIISLGVAVFTVAGEIVVCSMTAYAIARNWSRKLFRWSFYYLLAAMFIPFPVIALPQVKLTSLAHLDNPVGVTILHVLFGLGFNVLLYTAFLRSVPYELEESARMDGCNTWQTFWKLIFRLLAPMNATVGIFAFLASWNDFMLPNLITSSPNQQTLPVVQAIFQTQFSSNYNISFASYLMAMLPTLIVYLFAQRWVMSGVTQGAIK